MNNRYIGNLIKEERGKMTQKELAKKVGVDRSTISKYESGTEMSKDMLRIIAEALNSLKLKMIADGTTTETIIFDQVNLDFYVSLSKTRQELLEAAQAINDVLDFAHNVESIEELKEQERERIEYMLEQIDDVNHACDMADLVCHEFGADINKRNEKNLQKYYAKGYLSSLRDVRQIKNTRCNG
ncbi:helix-turn-helix domain-containing protein [Natroniella sp. ANB-PHB2]|uniref:helix-turn-helix domain-containing protein n=1 Tax=Natroniella sp. ANB-PHB2 TaxID=3384444 RepID=UPI0038D4397E